MNVTAPYSLHTRAIDETTVQLSESVPSIRSELYLYLYQMCSTVERCMLDIGLINILYRPSQRLETLVNRYSSMDSFRRLGCLTSSVTR